MISDDRSARLTAAMAEAGLDMLLVYGNAWQGDYLRYATDFGIVEGQALALVGNDGHVTLYLDSPLEVDRAELDCPAVEVIHAPELIAEVDAALDRLRNHRIGAAPQRLLPRRIAARAKELDISGVFASVSRWPLAATIAPSRRA
jgi:Xaa-Pro dipeptidase